jgi:hypothetical protein
MSARFGQVFAGSAGDSLDSERVDRPTAVSGLGKMTRSRNKWRRTLFYTLASVFIYFLTVGPVTRYAPEFADWVYAPLSPLADLPLTRPLLQGWLILWGVDAT